MRKLVPVLMCCMAVATGASAREGEVVVTSGDGAILSISPETLYRALGDRIVSGNDVIGNNAVDWNRVDPSLPFGRIAVSLPVGTDEAQVLGAVRLGCELSGGTTRACERVGLRRDRIVRQGGGYFDDGGLASQRALIRQQRLDREAERARAMAAAMPEPEASGSTSVITTVVLAPPPSPPPPPPSAPEPSFVTVAPVPVAAPPRPAPVPVPMLENMPDLVVPAMPMSVRAPVGNAATSSSAPPRPTGKPGRVYASRMFTGRDGFPPEAFAAYGIVAFSTLATSEDRDTYIAICEAFFSALINSGDIAAPASEQMVTVWPVDDRRRPDLTASLNTTRAREGSCENAVEYYDVQVARGAIGEAMQAGIALPGRGPFLLAWAPAGMKGSSDAVVLAADMSDVKTVADAKDVLRIWREDIEQDPELWQNGFSAEKLRVKLRLIVDRYGEGLLRFLGG